MNGTRYRSQLRTNVPGDTRVSGRFTEPGGAGAQTMTLVEGAQYYAKRTADAGTYQVFFGSSSTNPDSFKGLVSFTATPIILDPATDTKVRFVQIKSIDTNSNGTVASVTFVTLNKTFAPTTLTTGDGIAFEAVVRGTEIKV
jgi:hypothetical protein